MIAALLEAVAVGTAIIVGAGFVLKSVIGLRSEVVWISQTAIAFVAVDLLAFSGPYALAILIAPTMFHIFKKALHRLFIYRVKGGHYGEAALWAYNLFEENDSQFIHAHSVLPEQEVREVGIIAESQEEMRQLMIERCNEHLKEDLSDSGTNR